MKATMRLPEEYRLLQNIDLEKNRKQMIIVNGLALIVGVLVAVPMVLLAPEEAEFPPQPVRSDAARGRRAGVRHPA